MNSLVEKLKSLWPSHRRAHEDEMREELESLAAIAERGELGNLTRAAEDARGAWTIIWLEQLLRDLQYAFRALRHNPAFAATAVLSLALGIGANTAIFSLIDALLLRWLPVHNPQELVQLKMRSARGSGPPGESFSYPIARALSARADLFAHVCGFSSPKFDVGPPGAVAQIPGSWVTGDCFATFGLNPSLGRLLNAEDDQPGAPPGCRPRVRLLGKRPWP